MSQAAGPGLPSLSAARRGARSLSIIVPAYNEERRLPTTLAALADYVRSVRLDVEIVVVDNGSQDGTSARVMEAAADVPFIRLIRSPVNSGKGGAILSGMRSVRKEAVLYTDADLSTPIGELDRLWERYDAGYDVVIASRRMKDSRITRPQPVRRRIAGRVFNGLVRLLCVRGYADTQCGFKLFRRTALDAILPRLRTSGFAIDVEILLRARERGLRVAEVGVAWNDSPGSRVRLLRHGTRMLAELLRMRGLG